MEYWAHNRENLGLNPGHDSRSELLTVILALNKNKLNSLIGGALILIHLWYSMLSHNWWKHEYLIRQLHQNSKNAIQEKKNSCT